MISPRAAASAAMRAYAQMGFSGMKTQRQHTSPAAVTRDSRRRSSILIVPPTAFITSAIATDRSAAPASRPTSGAYADAACAGWPAVAMLTVASLVVSILLVVACVKYALITNAQHDWSWIVPIVALALIALFAACQVGSAPRPADGRHSGPLAFVADERCGAAPVRRNARSGAVDATEPRACSGEAELPL